MTKSHKPLIFFCENSEKFGKKIRKKNSEKKSEKKFGKKIRKKNSEKKFGMMVKLCDRYIYFLEYTIVLKFKIVRSGKKRQFFIFDEFELL